jgi:thioredoxin reductase (NADPH)
MQTHYDCIIVGGGIAGLQAAIQLGRYRHAVLVIDAGEGRSVLCRAYHNLLGYPDGVSGEELRKKGRAHAERLGIHFLQDTVTAIRKTSATDEYLFEIQVVDQRSTYFAKRILLATGVLDRLPPWPELIPCLGLSVYICPDCDGYEVRGKKTLVLGSGKAGAGMALALSYWTNQITYINHEQHSIPEQLQEKLDGKGIETVHQPIAELLTVDHWRIEGVRLADGRIIAGEKAFLAFGQNKVKSELARQLGVERLEDKHIVVDPRTKMTNVPYVWAAGDVTVHSEQVTIAMGDGSQAAIWIHKSLVGAMHSALKSKV